VSTIVEVRQAECEGDVRAVTPLFDAYRAFYKMPRDPEASYAYLDERWRLRESVLFVAFVAGAPAGFVHLFPSYTSLRLRRLWILNDLYVDPAQRRLGVARTLMRRAERHARETGATGLTLATDVVNVNAQALYRSEGYERPEEFYTFNRFFEDA
jgi:GNAT superfamily N-acetyltransferase